MSENKVSIRVAAQGRQAMTETKARNHRIVTDEPSAMGGNDQGPNPLETVLGALAGCEMIVAGMVARELEIPFEGIDFDIEGSLDRNGVRGLEGARVHFEAVTIRARVQTTADAEQVEELRRKTDARCPVMQLLLAADVAVDTLWEPVVAQRPAESGAPR